MAFQTVVKAMQLKNLIDGARHHLPKIGRCVSLELDFRRRVRNKAEEERYINGRKWHLKPIRDKKFESLQDKLVEIYRAQGFKMASSGFEEAGISVLGKKFAWVEDIFVEDVERWYAAGTLSGFGNVLKQETEHNAQVRSSRELDSSQFSVSQHLLDDIALRWGDDFVPRSVTVRPYKLVIYGPGDHFTKIHRKSTCVGHF